MNNCGVRNETELVESLNNKKVKQLNNNLQNFIKSLFKEKTPNEKITCKLTDNYIKPDLLIEYGSQAAYVSVKSPRSNEMHMEDIKSFILFLRSLNVSKETQKTLLLYQFGDGTMDGSGKKRKNYHEVYDWLQERIKAANEELNDRFDLIEKVVERVIFQGVDITAHEAEFIYLGNVDFGVTVSKKQVMTYLKNKPFNFYENLHIGPILLRPHARYSNREVVSDERRKQIVCYWTHFPEDLDYIDKHYSM